MFGNFAYTLLGIFGFCKIIKALASKEDLFVTLLLNVLFGGTFFVILNICRIELPLTWMSGTCIAVGGFPGVILLLILKFVFNIYV